MSWRDRLARRDSAEQPVADSANSAKSSLSLPIGTNGHYWQRQGEGRSIGFLYSDRAEPERLKHSG